MTSNEQKLRSAIADGLTEFLHAEMAAGTGVSRAGTTIMMTLAEILGGSLGLLLKRDKISIAVEQLAVLMKLYALQSSNEMLESEASSVAKEALLKAAMQGDKNG
jgi:hypothetical protein